MGELRPSRCCSVAQSCPTVCNHMNCSSPVFPVLHYLPVHAHSLQSCPTLRNPMDCGQAPLSMGLFRQEYWSGLPLPPPGALPDPGIEPVFPALQADSLLTEIPWKPSLSSAVCSNSCPLSRWCHPTISSSVVPFSSCLQSFPDSESFPMGQFFTSGGQSTGASTSASVLPMNIKNWYPLGLAGLTSLQSKGLSRVFSNTTVWKHQSWALPTFTRISLEVDSLAPVKPWDECNPDPTWQQPLDRLWARTTQLSHCWLSDPPKLCKIIIVCYFKQLNFRMFGHTPIQKQWRLIFKHSLIIVVALTQHPIRWFSVALLLNISSDSLIFPKT